MTNPLSKLNKCYQESSKNTYYIIALILCFVLLLADIAFISVASIMFFLGDSNVWAAVWCVSIALAEICLIPGIICKRKETYRNAMFMFLLGIALGIGVLIFSPTTPFFFGAVMFFPGVVARIGCIWSMFKCRNLFTNDEPYSISEESYIVFLVISAVTAFLI